MTFLADLSYLNFHIAAGKPVKGMYLKIIKAIEGDVFGKFTRADLPSCLFFKLSYTFHPKNAYLTVPRAGMSIAFNTLVG